MPASTWAAVFLPLFAGPALPPSARAGYLIALAALAKGAGASATAGVADKIVTVLADPDISQSVDVRLREQALRTTQTLIQVLGSASSAHALALFTIVLSMLAANADLEARLLGVLGELAAACGCDTPELFQRHTAALLASLASGRDTWTNHSHGRMLFAALLAHAGTALGESVGVIMSIFASSLAPARDIEMRLGFFSLLGRLVSDARKPLHAHGELAPHLLALVKDMILPNLVWQAGRSASALRSAALAALLSLCNHGAVTAADVGQFVDPLIPLLLAALDDDFEPTRLFACHLTRSLLTLGADSFQGDYARYERLHKLYTDLLKRLDDNSDAVRVASLGAWAALAGCLGPDYDKQLYQAHIEGMVKGLLVHLDDPQPAIHDAVLSVLKVIGRADAAAVSAMVAAARHKHRQQTLCDDLLAALQPSA